MKNSKTDAVDAETLAQYAERMDFVAWTRPSNEKIALRSFARRIDALTRQKAAAKNNCHALSQSQENPKAVLRDVKLAISQLEKRIARLSKEAMLLIGQHAELERAFQLLTSDQRHRPSQCHRADGRTTAVAASTFPPRMGEVRRTRSAQLRFWQKRPQASAFIQDGQPPYSFSPLYACFECQTARPARQGVFPTPRG